MRAQHDFRFVGAERIAIEAAFPKRSRRFRGSGLENSTRALATPQVVLGNGVALQSGKMHPVVLKIKPRHPLGSKGAFLENIFQRDRFLGKKCEAGEQQEDKSEQSAAHRKRICAAKSRALPRFSVGCRPMWEKSA